MRLDVTYTPGATYSREQTGDIITVAQVKEGKILTKTCNNIESGDDDSIKKHFLENPIEHKARFHQLCFIGAFL